MLSDVVIEKCSWHWKIFIGTVLGQCIMHSSLEKHKTLPKRLPSRFMPDAQILGSLNCPECDSSLSYCVWVAGKFKECVYHRVSGKSQPVAIQNIQIVQMKVTLALIRVPVPSFHKHPKISTLHCIFGFPF